MSFLSKFSFPSFFKNPFNQARLKLTGLYLLIIALISFFFSLVIYQLVSVEIYRFSNNQRLRLERRYEAHFPNLPPSLVELDEDLLLESQSRLKDSLLLINLSILLSSGFVAYYLAGRTLKPIQLMLEDQRRFVADASHELKTPLTSLKTALEVYLRNPNATPKETQELISENLLEVNRLQKLTQNLLDLAHHSDKKVVKLKKINLSPILKETLLALTPQASDKNIKLVSRFPSSLKIKGDPDSLRSLFTILLDNAIKYSPKDKKVTLKALIKKKYVLVKVIDQGIGIDPQDQPHIFSRFYRADQSRTKSKVEGFGLGLSIAKNILDFNHAKISLSSKPGLGSTFTVSLPFIR